MPTTTSGSVSYTVPNSLLGYTENPSLASFFNQFSNITYFQRVYSSGLSRWCYYSTIGFIDSSPASSQTSPNWTGTINNHQIVSVKGTV
jgi:hypothetical protein